MSISKMIIITAALLPIWARAQVSVKFFMKERYEQQDKITTFNFFNLSKNGIAYRSKPTWEGNEVIVPDTGVYILNSSLYLLLAREYRVVGDKNPIIDTLTYPDIIVPCGLSGKKTTVLFCCAGENCNGYQVEYYPNGAKRIDGVFKNGLALGDVTLYRLNGKPLTIFKFKKLGIFKKRILCDKNGKRRGSRENEREFLGEKMPNIN